MATGNVLVIGNSGVGKSTLINAFLNDEERREKKSYTTRGTTSKIEVYPANNVPFQLIDTVGFEPSFLKKHAAINEIKKWSKDAAVKKNEDREINVIWFCVDGTSRKLFSDTIKNLLKATKIWKSVPIIVVITKSYSESERKENICMVQDAFREQSKKLHFGRSEQESSHPDAIIPVVAQTYHINQDAAAYTSGLTELIDATNELMPEGKRAAKRDIARFNLGLKRIKAHSLTVAAATTGAVVGAAPLHFADALLLDGEESALVDTLRKIYELPDDDNSNKIIKSLLTAGGASAIGKSILAKLKMVPGLNIAAEILNALVAAAVIFSLGEAATYIFEKIYLGEIDTSELDKIRKLVEDKLTPQLVNQLSDFIKKVIEGLQQDSSAKDAVAMLIEMLVKENSKLR